jgi:hypothetical protein
MKWLRVINASENRHKQVLLPTLGEAKIKISPGGWFLGSSATHFHREDEWFSGVSIILYTVQLNRDTKIRHAFCDYLLRLG